MQAVFASLDAKLPAPVEAPSFPSFSHISCR